MRKLKAMRTAAALALAVGTMTAVGASQAQAADTRGCPSGYFCMYPGTNWNNNTPTHKFFNYGTYNLNNVIGNYIIFNNQTGGAKVRTCTGYNATGCEGFMNPGDWHVKNMTPINSIVLLP